MCQVYVDEVIPVRPVLLVHEPQSMEEFMHQHQQAVLWGEARGIQEHVLNSTYHTQVAFALRASLYHHVVDSCRCCFGEDDTGHLPGDVRHRLLHQSLVLPGKKSFVKMEQMLFILNASSRRIYVNF